MNLKLKKLLSQYFAENGRKGGSKMSPAKLAALKENAKRPRPNARGKREKQ